jgi:hypothetical protein
MQVLEYFKVLLKHLPRGSEEGHKKNSFRVASFQAEISIRDLMNTKMCYPFSMNLITTMGKTDNALCSYISQQCK